MPTLDEGAVRELVETVHEPVLAELDRRGTPFVGLLYAGLMLTESGPRVLEFNCRFGDPETQVVLPLVDDDVLELLHGAATGNLDDEVAIALQRHAVTVVLAAKGYPDTTEIGVEIGGIEDAEALGAVVYHAGTASRDGRLVSAGGRVLDITAVGDTLAAARTRVYDAIERIDFPGAQYRRDIALVASHVAS